MSETIFRFRAKELLTIRICCAAKGCTGVLEMSVKNAAKKHGEINCPVCRAALKGDSPMNLIGKFAQALDVLVDSNVNGSAEIEFTLPSGKQES